jgi:ankyrin repeat protein
MTPDNYLKLIKSSISEKDFNLIKELLSQEVGLEGNSEKFSKSVIKRLIDSKLLLAEKKYCLERLLKKGLNPNISIPNSKFTLTDHIVHSAWSHNNEQESYELLKIILEYTEPNFGLNAISLAVRLRQVSLVELLLKKGADPNTAIGASGDNIFSYALDKNYIGILNLLLEHPKLKTDFTPETAVKLYNLSSNYSNLSKTKHFKTFFRLNPIQGLKEELAYEAIKMNDPSVLKKVLGEKWQLYFTSNFLEGLVQRIGVDSSKQAFKEEIEAFLVKHKDAGLKLIENLNKNNFKEAEKYIKHLEWLNVNEPGSSNTALIITIIKDKSYLTKALLDKGADPNIRGQYIPLLYAAKEWLVDIVELLLEYRAFANAQEKNGDTALTLGAKHIDIVKALLDYWADPSLQNGLKQTVYDLANDETKEVIKANMQQKWVERIGDKTGKSGKWSDREPEEERGELNEICS